MTPTIRHTLEHLRKNWRIGLPVILVIAFAFLLLNLLLFTNQVGNGFLSTMKGSLSFTLYLKEDIDPFTLKRLMEDLERRPDVMQPVVYTSPEEALQKFGNSQGERSLSEDSTLPGTLIVTPKEPGKRETIEAFLLQSPYRPFISIAANSGATAEGKTYARVTSQIERLQKLIRGIMLMLLGFASLVIVVVIFVSIKLGSDSRKRELVIMKMVGASPYFLEFPYLLEAMIYSVFGLVSGSILFFLTPVLGFFPTDALLQTQWQAFPFTSIFLFELLLALLLGFIGGIISIQTIIRKNDFHAW